MTSHETYREQLLDLAYGELGRRQARALQAHLEDCAECRAELARMTSTRSVMSSLADEPAPARGESILLAAAREVARDRRPKPFLPSWIWGASIGAVGAAAAIVLTVRLAGTVSDPLTSTGIEQVATAPGERAAEPSSVTLGAPPGGESRAAAGDGSAPAAPAKAARAKVSERKDEVARPASAGVKRKTPPAQPKAPRDDGETRLRESDVDGGSSVAGGSPPAREEKPVAGAVARQDRRAEPPASPSRSASPGAADRVNGQGAMASSREAPPAAAPAPAPPARQFARPPPEEKAAQRLEEQERSELAASALADAEEAPPRTRGAAKKAPSVSAEDAVARHQALLAQGGLRSSTSTFPRCPGESARTVERDEQGRVVRVTWQGSEGDTPFEAEQLFSADGRLAVVRYRSRGKARELRLGEANGPAAAEIPPWLLEPRTAAEAGRLPPRCEE